MESYLPLSGKLLVLTHVCVATCIELTESLALTPMNSKGSMWAQGQREVKARN